MQRIGKNQLMRIFLLQSFILIRKRLLTLPCPNKDMSTLKGLNDRVEILNELRFYFRNEQKLLKEGWMSESDFFKTIETLIKEYLLILLQEE